MLRAAEATLPQREREAWEWVCRRGASCVEASERLGISPNAIKQAVWRARRRLRGRFRSLGLECVDDVIGGEGLGELGTE